MLDLSGAASRPINHHLVGLADFPYTVSHCRRFHFSIGQHTLASSSVCSVIALASRRLFLGASAFNGLQLCALRFSRSPQERFRACRVRPGLLSSVSFSGLIYSLEAVSAIGLLLVPAVLEHAHTVAFLSISVLVKYDTVFRPFQPVFGLDFCLLFASSVSLLVLICSLCFRLISGPT